MRRRLLEGSLLALQLSLEEFVQMIDFLIGLAFLAVVLSPAVLASLHKDDTGDSSESRYSDIDIDEDF
jgi:hypothetical protein